MYRNINMRNQGGLKQTPEEILRTQTHERVTNARTTKTSRSRKKLRGACSTCKPEQLGGYNKCKNERRRFHFFEISENAI